MRGSESPAVQVLSEQDAVTVKVRGEGRSRHITMIVSGDVRVYREIHPYWPAIMPMDHVRIVLKERTSFLIIPNGGAGGFDNFVVDEVFGEAGSSLDIGGRNVRIVRCSERVRLFKNGNLAIRDERGKLLEVRSRPAPKSPM